MRKIIESPTAALMRDIWQRNRPKIMWMIGIMLVDGLVNLLSPAGARAGQEDNHATGIPFALVFLNVTCLSVVMVLTLAIFAYTEHDAESGAEGFPRRLFTLPVSSLQLITVPMLLGITGAEVLYWAWKFAFLETGTLFVAVLFAAYMVFYQAFLWTIGGRLGPIRMIVLAVVALIFFAASLEPSGAHATYSERSLTQWFCGLAIAAFCLAWTSIKRQRSGGGGPTDWMPFVVSNGRLAISGTIAPYLAYHIGSQGFSRDSPLIALFQLVILGWSTFTLLRDLCAYVSDRLPVRKKPFGSVVAAQFWFEWHRSGFVLPLLIGGLLCAVAGPASWYFRDQPGETQRLLIVCLFMPILLAAAVGKAFSKPDFWSGDMSIPIVVAARPLATVDLIAIKLRVAAASAALSWLLVLTFLSIWLPFWASPVLLATIRSAISHVYGTSLLPQLMAVSLLVLGFVLTWRFLVVSLWLGLSGANKVFALTAVPYAIVPIIGLGVGYGLAREHAPVISWIQTDLTRWGSILEWIAVLAIVVKLWTAASLLRRVHERVLRQWLMYWLGVTVGLVFVAMSLLQGIREVGTPAIPGLVTLVILTALLIVPLGRLSLAPMSLARNRHR